MLTVEARSIFAALTSFGITFALAKPFIRHLQKKQIGQVVREDGPLSHLSKKNTPTMGGILMILSIVCASIIWGNCDNTLLLTGLFILITGALIGFLDDYLKIRKKNSEGLKSRWKLCLQGLVAFLASIALYLMAPEGFNLAIPFIHTFLNLGLWMVLLFWFVIVGSANAVNFTDGQDGLVSFCVAIVCGIFIIFAIQYSNLHFTQAHKLLFMPGSIEMAIFASAIAGSCLGFLWVNAYPAQIFMGDVGSQGLGGALAVIAISLKSELLYVLIGGVFVIETLSIILQVSSYKLRRGKRIFRMAPIHHHFELGGMHESKVTVRFWILTILFALIALLNL